MFNITTTRYLGFVITGHAHVLDQLARQCLLHWPALHLQLGHSTYSPHARLTIMDDLHAPELAYQFIIQCIQQGTPVKIVTGDHFIVIEQYVSEMKTEMHNDIEWTQRAIDLFEQYELTKDEGDFLVQDAERLARKDMQRLGRTIPVDCYHVDFAWRTLLAKKEDQHA